MGSVPGSKSAATSGDRPLTSGSVPYLRQSYVAFKVTPVNGVFAFIVT